MRLAYLTILLIFSTSILPSLATASDYYLKTGEFLQLGQDTVFCGQGTGGGIPSCQESCQYYDNFNSKCLYKVSCELEGPCIKKTSCQHWESFKSECRSEKVEFMCKNNFGCTESCQRFDAFDKECTYQSRCELLSNGCFRKTSCEKFDSFNGDCNSEKKDLLCP